MPQTSYQLTKEEQNELTRCETTIRRFVKSGFDACQALKTIREKELFLKSHETFESYCEEVWSIERRTASRMIRAASAYAVLENAGVNQLPFSESVIRPLVPLEDEQKISVWQQAIKKAKGNRITASVVDGIVNSNKKDKPARSYSAKSVVAMIAKIDLSDSDKTMIIEALK